jgi:hypothetical protein
VNELALFAGGGGSILAGKLLGWSTVCAVEIDAGARKILLDRQRDGVIERFPIWDDVKTFDGYQWRGQIDVISGGFPCQDISSAGHGAGIEGERSGLWVEFARIILEVRPKFVFVENSPMLTSRGLGRVLGDLAGMGFHAQWECSERLPLELHTNDEEFTWLLTPTANSWRAWTFRSPLSLIRKNHADGNLPEQLMRLFQRMITPRCQEILMMVPAVAARAFNILSKQ